MKAEYERRIQEAVQAVVIDKDGAYSRQLEDLKLSYEERLRGREEEMKTEYERRMVEAVEGLAGEKEALYSSHVEVLKLSYEDRLKHREEEMMVETMDLIMKLLLWIFPNFNQMLIKLHFFLPVIQVMILLQFLMLR